MRIKRPRGWKTRQTMDRGEYIPLPPLDYRSTYRIQTDSYFRALLPGKRIARWRPKDVKLGIVPSSMKGEFKFYREGTGPQREDGRYTPGRKEFLTSPKQWQEVKDVAKKITKKTVKGKPIITLKALRTVLKDFGYKPSVYYERRPNRSDKDPRMGL